MKLDRGLIIFGFLALFLSLLPFMPEPHLVGKIRWLMGGAVGMEKKDYIDLCLHGLPILSFLCIVGLRIGQKLGAAKKRS